MVGSQLIGTEESIARADAPAFSLPRVLRLTADVDRLKRLLEAWVAQSEPEMSALLRYQLAGPGKSFRPVTTFACYRSTSAAEPSDDVMRRAAAVELMHNATLIIDDILDRSRRRRANLSLHCRFGSLPALMTAGYLTAAASRMVAAEPRSVGLIAELVQRLAVAECYQWRVRRHPLGVEDWRAIASEDTGSMFQTCARLGAADDRLSRFGLLLGILYHGCDDVADVRETTALGGGGGKDLADGILTLPAAIALRNPRAAALFRSGSRAAMRSFGEVLMTLVPEAESYLDGIAAEARNEAVSGARRPERLLELVDYTRGLSAA